MKPAPALKPRHQSDLFIQIVKLSPHVLLTLLILPVFAGLLGILLPAFSWIPSLQHTSFSLLGFDALWQTPGLTKMITLSISTGLISTILALVMTLMILGVFFNSLWLNRIQQLLSPILAIPHAAAAIAISFLISPSGIISRLISPLFTDWELAPNGLFPHDEYGLSIILGLLIKELPFLLLVSLGVLAQPELGKKLRQQHKVAVNLGYRPMTAFFKVVLPNLYPMLRLPTLAVLVYASSSVEIPLILGPNTPPTLAVEIMHWFNDVDLNQRIKASAGALLQLVLTGGLLALWLGVENIIKAFFRHSLINGKRQYGDVYWQKITIFLTALIILSILLSLIGIIIWSLAGFWRFPSTLPDQFVLSHFTTALTHLGEPLFNTLVIGIITTSSAILITLLCLESEQLNKKQLSNFTNFIIYLPLLIPSIAFLFGLIWLQQLTNTQSAFLNVVMAHILFVLPYVFLSLSSSYRQLDPRFSYVAESLGAPPLKVFLQIKLPQLLTPILIATALGLAISFGQYLPTLLAGGGRIDTITTEAVAFSNGASRRTSAVYALIQVVMPLIGFIVAWTLPKYFVKKSPA